MARTLKAALFLIVLLALGLVAAAQDEQTYTVQRGDTLFRISQRFGVSISAIAQANNIANPNLIFAGTVLRIPAGGTTPAPQPTQPPQPPTEPSGTYTVQRGDTLGRIAQRFGVTLSAIRAANPNIRNINLIFPGQVINIPAGGTVVQPPSGSTPAPQPTQPGPVVPPPPGGFAVGAHVFSYNFADLARNTGMTWLKQQIRWNQGEPPSIAQVAIDGAKARGFRILLSITGNPSQLAANPTQYYQDFANFLGGVAQLGADAIEVWNEPNIDKEWPRGLISGAQYTAMLSAAYQAIKANNPNTLVISGAPAPTGGLGCSTNGCNDDAYIGQMAAAGAARFMDCVGIHYNAGTVPPTATSGAPVGSASHYSWYYPTMVSLYTRTFPGKPLCFTEIGYLSGEGFPPLPAGFSWAQATTVAQQAEWLGQAVRLARQSGNVRLFIIWNLDSTQFGADPQAGYAIIRPDGTCPACTTIRAALP
ncbi:LysM domain-containing protein [Aggregatilineales bacterium SYSU G02658]